MVAPAPDHGAVPTRNDEVASCWTPYTGEAFFVRHAIHTGMRNELPVAPDA